MRTLLVILLLCGSVSAAELPDPKKTPGEAEPRLTKEMICDKAFRTGPWRHVTTALKKQVYASYNKKPVKGICCEVDHLISLELAGSNSKKNLWPQQWAEAKVKDKLENELHKLVCQDTISLEEAQREIADNWVDAYKKYIGPLSGGINHQ